MDHLRAVLVEIHGQAAVPASWQDRGVLHADAPDRITRRLDRLGVGLQLATALERVAAARDPAARNWTWNRSSGATPSWTRGVLIAPALLLTAHHVLPGATEATVGSVEFDRGRGPLRPEVFFLGDSALDLPSLRSIPTRTCPRTRCWSNRRRTPDGAGEPRHRPGGVYYDPAARDRYYADVAVPTR
ncbi:hypothetical protein ABZ816_09595 [Actinosynnema sp. NPDC047251]